MKSKLTILLLFSWFVGLSQSVPNSNHFTLGQVTLAVYGDSTVGRNTSTLFADADPAKFDATYGSQTMNPKTINGFRNYGYCGALATIQTVLMAYVTATTATATVQMSNMGGGMCAVTKMGMCYGTGENPTIAGSHTSTSITYSQISFQVTGLTQGATYHYRAYATNGYGTAYGADQVYYQDCRPYGLPKWEFYTRVNGGLISSSSDAIYYAANFSCVSTCEYDGNESYGSEGSPVYYVWGATNCNLAGDRYYVMRNPNTGAKYAVQVINGNLHYL